MKRGRSFLNKVDKKFVLYIDTAGSRIKIAVFDYDLRAWRHPRENGDPLIVDSRLRGNDKEVKRASPDNILKATTPFCCGFLVISRS